MGQKPIPILIFSVDIGHSKLTQCIPGPMKKTSFHVDYLAFIPTRICQRPNSYVIPPLGFFLSLVLPRSTSGKKLNASLPLNGRETKILWWLSFSDPLIENQVSCLYLSLKDEDGEDLAEFSNYLPFEY